METSQVTLSQAMENVELVHQCSPKQPHKKKEAWIASLQAYKAPPLWSSA